MWDTEAKAAFLALYAGTVVFFGWIFSGEQNAETAFAQRKGGAVADQPRAGVSCAGREAIIVSAPPAPRLVEIHGANAVITEPKP